MKGVVGKYQVHIHINYASRTEISGLMKRIKVRTSQILQQALLQLTECYWECHLWASDYGAEITGNTTHDMIGIFVTSQE